MGITRFTVSIKARRVDASTRVGNIRNSSVIYKGHYAEEMLLSHKAVSTLPSKTEQRGPLLSGKLCR